MLLSWILLFSLLTIYADNYRVNPAQIPELNGKLRILTKYPVLSQNSKVKPKNGKVHESSSTRNPKSLIPKSHVQPGPPTKHPRSPSSGIRGSKLSKKDHHIPPLNSGPHSATNPDHDLAMRDKEPMYDQTKPRRKFSLGKLFQSIVLTKMFKEMRKYVSIEKMDPKSKG